MIKLGTPKNRNYAAVVVALQNFVDLPNCDNVKAALIFGNSVIVGKDTKTGDVGVFFPVETQLLREFLANNNLFRKPEWGNVDQEKKGFFEEHGRVKAKRPNYVGEKVIRDMHDKYLAKPVEPVAYEPNLPSCIIVDIDGTVAKMNGRGPFEWDKVGSDLPKGEVIELVQHLANTDAEIIFVSGRDSVCRDTTMFWLRTYFPCFKDLFMRPAGDQRDDRIVKQEIYEREIKGKYNVRFVLDDRNKVVDMWRSLGLPCFQVAPGNF